MPRIYQCNEKCDDRPCFLVYPEGDDPNLNPDPNSNSNPNPKRCVITGGSCPWEETTSEEFFKLFGGDAGSGEGHKVYIEIEKLKLIAEYYEFPLTVFFTPVEELRKLEGKTRSEFIQKELEKLEKIKAILEEE